ncbi:MAG: 50S ribosomal protein L35 [Alphaproteobacteria bacterium]|nr:50S ribosomal protein L35 [Alphaproteobacteria bacterium]
MPKLKTKSAVKKRFRATATGKIKAASCNRNHFKGKRTKRALAACRHGQILDKSHESHIKKMAPYGL